MSKLVLKEVLSVLLCAVVANPSPILAASSEAAPRRALGSIASHGAVTVDQIQIPSSATLFAGDHVLTGNGSAAIQYKHGARILLASQTQADFAPGQVQLNGGMMTIQTVSQHDVVFAASTLRLEPASDRTAANVTLNDKKASVAVTEGSLNVIDPSGVQLASLRAGEAKLFEEAPASAPEPSAAASPSSSSSSSSSSAKSSSSRTWLIAAGAAAVGAAVGITGLVRANNADSRFDNQTSLVSELQSQNAALNTQANSLRAQLSSVSSYLSSVSGTSAQQQAALSDLSATLADLGQIEAQLNTIQQQTSQFLTQIAQQGGVATPAQLSQLQSLVAQQSSLNTRIQNDTNRFNADSVIIRNNVPPPFSPVLP